MCKRVIILRQKSVRRLGQAGLGERDVFPPFGALGNAKLRAIFRGHFPLRPKYARQPFLDVCPDAPSSGNGALF